MNLRWLFSCLLLGIAARGLSQKLQYSRQLFDAGYFDAAELVPNIGGYHHLLCFTAGKKPVLAVYDAGLRLQSRTELDFRVKENCDVRLAAFPDHYFLYTHVAGTTQHDLWRMDAAGNPTPLSARFQLLIDSLLNGSTATLQLVNENGHFCLLANTYYEVLKKMKTTVVEMDDNLGVLAVQKMLFPFNSSNETLHQTGLARGCLLALKSVRDPENGNGLQLVKVNRATGLLTTNSFNCSSLLPVSPVYQWNETDSTILLFSILREPLNSRRTERDVLVGKLDFSLQEKAAPALLKNQFRNGVAAGFLLLAGEDRPLWLRLYNETRPRRMGAGGSGAEPIMFEQKGVVGVNKYTSFNNYYNEVNQPKGFRFGVLNKKLHLLRDSVCANDNSAAVIQWQPSVQFSLGRQAFLLLQQNLASKHHGLLLVSQNDQPCFSFTDLPVNDHFDYLLPGLRAENNNAVLLPYTDKREMGLLKISLAP